MLFSAEIRHSAFRLYHAGATETIEQGRWNPCHSKFYILRILPPNGTDLRLCSQKHFRGNIPGGVISRDQSRIKVLRGPRFKYFVGLRAFTHTVQSTINHPLKLSTVTILLNRQHFLNGCRGCSKKWTPKFSGCFLSNRLELWFEILHFYWTQPSTSNCQLKYDSVKKKTTKL